MSTLSSQEPARGRANRASTIVQQLLTGVGGALMLLSPVVLCLAAGRWNWLAGWLFGLTLLISIILSRVLVAVKSPGLLAERARWVRGERTEGWDQILLPIVGVYGPLAVLVVAGLDERFGWPPPIAPWVQVIAYALVVAGFAFAAWAMVANRFFSAVVRIQTDRGQTVVTSGPYRFVRHPGYAGGMLAWLAAPLALASLWALLPAALIAFALVTRTILEDRMLRSDLPGYAEYAQRTRARLLPGVW
jgi:protein-S-isoprenylcysteine O-methyltransferase Ste14